MMECVHYRVSGREAASFQPGLPFPAGTGAPPELFLVQREPVWSFAAWRVTNGRQLTADKTGVSWLDPRRMGDRKSVV